MRIIISLLAVLFVGGAAHAGGSINSRGFMCVRNGNYADLVNVYTRQAIWRFGYTQQCDRAREQARTGYMCVPNGNAVSLIFRNGEIVQNFKFFGECEHVRREIISHM